MLPGSLRRRSGAISADSHFILTYYFLLSLLLEHSQEMLQDMSSQNEMMATEKSGQTEARRSAPGGHSLPTPQESLNCPSIEEVLSKLAVPPSSLPARTPTLDVEDQKYMFHSLQAFMRSAQPGDLQIDDSVDRADTESASRLHVDAIAHLRPVLDRLWKCQSEYLAQAAEVLANRSRDRE